MMSHYMILFGISFLLSFSLAGWLARKANMKMAQGVNMAVVSGSGAFLLMLLLDGWLLRSNLPLIVLFTAAAVMAFSAFFLAYRFYRDPERKTPEDDDIVVSPADGRIIYIREIRQGTVPNSIKGRCDIKLSELTKTDILNGETYLIGIMMTLYDVHVNRAPVSGRLVLMKHFAGKFLSLKDNAALTENERNTMVFESDKMWVGIVQIASKQVRRIVSYVSEGDDIRIGQRVGAILLGSQVDVVMAKPGASLLVREGQQVYAGETILARYESHD